MTRPRYDRIVIVLGHRSSIPDTVLRSLGMVPVEAPGPDAVLWLPPAKGNVKDAAGEITLLHRDEEPRHQRRGAGDIVTATASAQTLANDQRSHPSVLLGGVGARPIASFVQRARDLTGASSKLGSNTGITTGRIERKRTSGKWSDVITLERAVEASEIVSALKHYGVSQAEVGSVAGVSDRAVRNWGTGGIRPAHYDRLSEPRDIALLLSDSLTPRGTGQWLHARNRLLGGKRPLELLAQGRGEEVGRAAQVFVDGSYV